jgi:hypothetical protein
MQKRTVPSDVYIVLYTYISGNMAAFIEQGCLWLWIGRVHGSRCKFETLDPEVEDLSKHGGLGHTARFEPDTHWISRYL